MDKNTEVTELLGQLYFLTNDQRADIVKKFENIPAEGIEKLLTVLKEAKAQQEELFLHAIERDAEFPQKLQKFLHEISEDFKKRYEAEEKTNVDSILGPDQP
jgi:polyribonucleotide nucleotidyltransferase